MLNIDYLWLAAVGYLPVLATVATLGPLTGLGHAGIGVVVLGVAVCLSLRRRAGQAGRGHRPARRGAFLGEVVSRVLLATIGVGVLGAAFAISLAAGDALFLVILFGSRFIGRYGPRWAALGRSLLLPLTALFIAPPVGVGHNPLLSLAWAAGACLVASVWSTLIPAILPPPGPSLHPVRRAVRRVLRGSDGTAGGLPTAALALDGKLGDDRAARQALARLEYTVDCLRPGRAERSDVDSALAELAEAVAAHRPGPVAPAPVDPRDAPSSRARTRLALQSTLALTLAFVVGQTVFPEHWPWTAITVITVSLAARSRGEVLVRSGQRLLGAALATAVATPVASAVAGNRPLVVAIILTILGVGSYLRERSYVWWAMAVTSSLAFLYGLLGQTGGTTLLRERLLAIGLGALCAIGPALWLAPRSSDLVRKRTATVLRRLREALDEPDVAAVRRLDLAVVDLRTAAAPLLLVRQVRRGPEVGWVETLSTVGPPLRTLLVEPEPGTTGQLRRVLGQVGTEVRASRREP